MEMIISKWIKDNNNALTKTKPQAKYYNKYTTSGLCHHLHSLRDWGACFSHSGRPTLVREIPGDVHLSHG